MLHWTGGDQRDSSHTRYVLQLSAVLSASSVGIGGREEPRNSFAVIHMARERKEEKKALVAITRTLFMRSRAVRCAD